MMASVEKNDRKVDRMREALRAGFELGNRYELVVHHRGNRGLGGNHFRQRAGSSMEFLEHREYVPGDDLRHVDWSIMARRDQVVVKRFEQETTPVLDLVIDHSRSMNLADWNSAGQDSGNSAKGAAATKLLAAIYGAASSSHFHTRIWLAGSGIGQQQDPRGPDDDSFEKGCHLFPVTGKNPLSWPSLEFDSDQNLADAFLSRAPVLRQNGYRILISDLLFDADPFPIIKQLAQQAQRTVIIQLLSIADTTPPEPGNWQIIDSETGEIENVYIDQDLCHRYEQSLENHQARWHQCAARHGCLLVPMVAENVLSGHDLKELEEAQVLVANR